MIPNFKVRLYKVSSSGLQQLTGARNVFFQNKKLGEGDVPKLGLREIIIKSKSKKNNKNTNIKIYIKL